MCMNTWLFICYYCLLFSLYISNCSAIDVTKYGLTPEEIKRSPHYKNNAYHVDMSTESGEELMEHWANQGFSSLIAAIAMRRLPLVEEYQKENHVQCASKAETLVEHANCLLELEKDAHHTRLVHRKRYFNQAARKNIDSMGKVRENPDKEWVGSFRFARAKRSIKVENRKSYVLKTENDITPFGMITKHLSNSVLSIKKKNKVGKWQDTIERIAEKAKQFKEQKKIERMMKKRMEMFTKAADSMKKTNPNFNPNMVKKDNVFKDLESLIDNDELKDVLQERSETMTDTEKAMMVPMKLIRQATKLGLAATGHNMTGFDEKVVRIISPKIMTVVPQEEEARNNEIDVLSPTLFSLHDDGEGVEKQLSLNNLLGSLTNSQDSQRFLDFIVEATGVDEAVDRVEQKLNEQRRLRDDAMGRGPDGQPLYFTKENITKDYPENAKRIEVLEKLDQTYTVAQLKEMNRTGYTIMNHEQLELVYGEQSVYKNLKFMNMVKNMSRNEIDRSIMSTIKEVAREKVKFEARKKDIVLSPIVGSTFVLDPVAVSQPAILSPVVLTSLILSPSIYGVMILSPWLMVPVILSPRILTPVVLNPFLMVTVILSPLAFNPFIMCPGALNPFVLSPLVLSPFIMSPQVFTPLILSPFALTPIILNPLAASPLVLSPFVLSPTILSPQYVSAVILSPYALSPAWGSDGAMVTVFASPSWLS